MTYLRNLLQTEPAITIGLITSALTMAAAFGLGISDDQIVAITTFVAALLPFLASVLIRQAVYAPNSVDQALKLAIAPSEADGEGTIPAIQSPDEPAAQPATPAAG